MNQKTVKCANQKVAFKVSLDGQYAGEEPALRLVILSKSICLCREREQPAVVCTNPQLLVFIAESKYVIIGELGIARRC
ncbi:hypothetical protein MASR2M48_33930 [Spirochaetota bacterium]